MEKREVKFIGGPIDGQTRYVDIDNTLYKHEQPPVADDIRIGEIPVGFFPPMHEYLYEESPEGSGTFIYIEQRHQ